MYQFIGPICHLVKDTKRSIIVVKTTTKLQAFYQSSGRNSGKPGTWFPFDGITQGPFGLWYAKDNYCPYWYMDFHRYGTQEFKDISDWLGTQEIHEGEIIECPKKINLWINNEYSRPFNELLELSEQSK